MSWHVYLLRCADGTYYAGVTNDLARRLASHNSGSGAKYTRSRRPVVIVWKRPAKDRSGAQRLEARLKRLPRAAKRALIDAEARKRL